MGVEERRVLSLEAKMQLKALKTIRVWKMIAIAISTLGVAMAYAGIAGTRGNIFFDIFGVVLMVLGLAGALILNLGLKNGRKNVDKILKCVQGTDYEV